jgi:hypothetical protein
MPAKPAAAPPDPAALGLVLALLATAEGRVVERSAVKGQLYVSPAEVVVLRPAPREALLDRTAKAALALSLALVVVNLLQLQSQLVLWVAAGLQAVYWLTRPLRLRHQVAQPLDAAGLEAARQAGRAAITVPASAIRELVPPPPRGGLARKPARLVLPDGAVELWLDEAAFAEVRRALGRG